MIRRLFCSGAPLLPQVLIKQNPSQIRGIFHLMGGNICSISAWRLTRCIYAQREQLIHHRAVILRLSGLSGRRGDEKKNLGLGQVSRLPTHISTALLLDQRFQAALQGSDSGERPPRPPSQESKNRGYSLSCHSPAVCPQEAWLVAGPRLSCEMGRLRISAFKVGSAMTQNLRGGG